MYYLVINGQRTGPYEAHDIQRMLKQGAIGYETLFWKDGMFDWASVGSQRHLFETTYQPPQAQFQPQPQPQFQQPQYQQQYQQPQYQQPQYQQPQYQQQQQMQVYQQPQMMYQQPMFSSPPKSRVAFILLGIFLGSLGVHNFYAGYVGKGIAQLLITIFLWWTIIAPVAVMIWYIIEVCITDRDARGNPLV